MMQTQRVRLLNLETSDPATGRSNRRAWDMGKARPAQLPTGTARHLSFAESDGPYRQTEIRLTNLPIRLASGKKGARGSAPLLVFPAGVVTVFSVVADLSLSTMGDGSAPVEVAFGSDERLADLAPPSRIDVTGREGRGHVFSAHGEPPQRLVGFPSPAGVHLNLGAAADALRRLDVVELNGAVWIAWLAGGPF